MSVECVERLDGMCRPMQRWGQAALQVALGLPTGATLQEPADTEPELQHRTLPRCKGFWCYVCLHYGKVHQKALEVNVLLWAMRSVCAGSEGHSVWNLTKWHLKDIDENDLFIWWDKNGPQRGNSTTFWAQFFISWLKPGWWGWCADVYHREWIRWEEGLMQKTGFLFLNKGSQESART